MSGWRNVLSGVPQGSVHGPVLFLLFIDDLYRAASLRQIIKQFADDTKIAQTIEKLEDSMELMQAIIAWTGCASGQPNGACHLMLKNAKLCTLAYTVHNPRHSYQMNGNVLSTTENQQDIGVIVSNCLKPAQQYKKAAKTASTVLGQGNKSLPLP